MLASTSRWNRASPFTTLRGAAVLLSLICTFVIVDRIGLFGSNTVLSAFRAAQSAGSSTTDWNNDTSTETEVPWQTQSTCERHSSTVTSRLCDVQNETLGFQDVFMISLPERTDKQDAFAVKAGLSGIRYHKMYGVQGSEVSSKALPYTMDQRPANIGSWRAHLNVMQHMVEHRIESALIFEDDADWDVSIKAQLVQFARGTRHVLHEADRAPSHSPYGDQWDMLWLGHCCANTHPLNTNRFLVPHDPTVMSSEKNGMCDEMEREHSDYRDDSTRVVFQMRAGYCSAAYALSLRAAETVLYRMSMLPFNFFFDNGLADMCSEELPFQCVASHPTLIGVSKPAGPESRGSDIESGTENVRERPISERIVFAVGQNIDRLLNGMTIFRSQAPDVTGPEMSLEEIGRAVGYPAHVEGGTLVASETREEGVRERGHAGRHRKRSSWH